MAAFQSPSPSASKVKPLSPFVSKLKLLLSDPKYQDAIRWSGNGAAIVIFDADTFKRIILDRTAEMFKTKNFTSFVRQLNLYGFRKVPTNGKSDPNKNMKFEHPHFLQDQPHLMHLVQRTCTSSKKRKAGEPLDYKTTPRGGPARGGRRGGESFAREKSLWLNEYYSSMAVKEEAYSACEDGGLCGGDGIAYHSDDNLALEYMYEKFSEEQHAVQLLMYLKYSRPNPDVFPGIVWNQPQLGVVSPPYIQYGTNTTLVTPSTSTTTVPDLTTPSMCRCYNAGCHGSYDTESRAD